MEILKCQNCKFATKIIIQYLLPLDQGHFVICENKDGDHFKHLLNDEHICDDKLIT